MGSCWYSAVLGSGQPGTPAHWNDMIRVRGGIPGRDKTVAAADDRRRGRDGGLTALVSADQSSASERHGFLLPVFLLRWMEAVGQQLQVPGKYMGQSGKLGTHLGNSPGALAELQQQAATVAAPRQHWGSAGTHSGSQSYGTARNPWAAGTDDGASRGPLGSVPWALSPGRRPSIPSPSVPSFPAGEA